MARGRHAARLAAALLSTTGLTTSLGAAAAAILIAGWALPAQADGGNGGGAAGGADASVGTGGAGTADSTFGGGGGGAGQIGGQGGSGDNAGGSGGLTPGANGQNGTSGGFFAGSGGGGGAHGQVVVAPGTLVSATGGRGGLGASDVAGGGGGGAGGWGTVVDTAGSFTNAGTVAGGQGGNGGGGGSRGGSGGSGGLGLFFSGGITSLVNSGTIAGGSGGSAGGSFGGTDGIAGAGGTGIVGGAGGLTIVNSGTISGGLSGDGTTRANAITFTGGGNVLQLQPGSSIIGRVSAGGGTFQLGGTSGSATFDVSQIGGGRQYQGFTSFQKVGGSTWTLTGTAVAGNWNINGGTLAISANNNLGPPSHNQFFNGGTLRLDASFTLTGATGLNSGGGTIYTDQANTLTGQLAGVGALTKAGSGTLTLTGNNVYTGGTTVNAGTLAVGNSSALGTNTVLLADGTTLQAAANSLSIGNAISLGGSATIDTQSNGFTLTNAILGGGSLTKIGTGTLTLDGANAAYTGATTVAAGTLALANFADISSSSLVTVNGGATFDISANGGTFIATLAGSGTVLMGNASNALQIDAGSTEFSGVISDGGNFGGLKISGGTQTLSGVNTYSDATQIGSGATLALKGNGSIANSAFVGVIGATATFDISQVGSATSIKALFGSGRVSLGSKTLVITSGSFFSGVIQDGGIAGGAGGSLVISAPGGQDLRGVNTYTGSTTITAGGLLTLSGNGSIASSSGLTLSGAGAQFDISAANGNVTIKDLSGVAGSTIQLGSNFLTVGTANSTTFAGVLDDSSNPGGGLVKQGSGTLTLTASNTFSGGTTVNAGLINFNSANNFGTGAITLNGGGLQWAVGNTTDISSKLAPLGAAGGTFDTNGNNVTLASTMSGAGALTKQGLGTLSLTASNTYGGGTVVTGGLINFTSASNFGSGMITLSGGGLQWASGSTADISAKLAPLGAGGGTFDTNGNTVTLATGLTGSGGLAKQGLGKLNLTGNSTYTGGTAVLAGTLAVNGSIAGNVAVGPAGTLGGNGTIFGSVVNTGTLAPGNSIGLLTVNGNYAQMAGSTYQVEVNNAGQGDRINVGGAAAIQGGTVQVLAAAGSYANSTTYTIVRATGGVSGVYSGVSSNFAFLTPTLSYDANDVFLTLALPGQNAFTPSFLALTPNQKAVGTALNQSFATASGDFATVIGALAGLNIAQGPAALDTISGQPYADFGTMNTNNAALFMNALGQQMANARGSSASTGQRQALAQACEIESCDAVGPLSAWASALGGLGSVLGDGNASTLTYNFGGAAAGIDYRFDPRFLAGIGVGYTHGTQWVNSFMGQGWSDSVSVAAYGSFTEAGFYVDALAGYAYYGNQLHRQILIPGLQQRTATGSTGANQFLGQIEGGYKLGIYAPASATITPFGRFQISSVTQNAFSESGAQSLNLNVAQQTTNSQRTTVGADLGSSIGLGNDKKLDLAVRLGWMHEFADVARPITAAFAGAPGNSFTVFGATPLRNAAVVGLQATTTIAAATQIYLRYDGEIATGTDNHALNIGVRMSW